MRKAVIIEGRGVDCPKCGQPTQIREHGEITQTELNRPYYFRRWFFCLNPDCTVSTHMREEFKVWNHSKEVEDRLEAVQAQLSLGDQLPGVDLSDPPWKS